jgi:hypothetical protein
MPHQVFSHIKNFLDNGKVTFEPSAGKHDRRIIQKPANQSLLEYMCSGRSEIKAQSALFPHLLSLNCKTEREKPLGGKFFDFWIPGGEGPEIFIELKHYSPHQTGQFNTLLGPSPKKNFNLDGDYRKFLTNCSNGSVLIQIGLYTAVEGLQSTGNPGGVKFVKSYVRRPIPLADYAPAARKDLQRWWPHLSRYSTPAGPATLHDFVAPQAHTFAANNGDIVTGRVCYFMGIVV